MSIFNTTSILTWSHEDIKMYFMKKGIELTDSQLQSGNTLANTPLIIFKKYYGNALGSKLYLIIRERIEREAALVFKKSNSSPIINTPSTSPDTPLSTYNLEGHLTLSDLNLGEPAIQVSKNTEVQDNMLDFKETDSRAAAYYDKLKKEHAKNKHNELKEFIDTWPPLLWQPRHLQFFLNSLEFSDDVTKTIPVDDFIFFSIEEFENIYPTRGLALYNAIRSKFPNPNIKKIIKQPFSGCL